MLSAVLSFWCGLAFAGLTFFAFHRLDLALGGIVPAASVALALAWAAGLMGMGWTGGARPEGRRLAAVLGMAAGLAALSAGLPAFVEDWRIALACGLVLVIGLLSARLVAARRKDAPACGIAPATAWLSRLPLLAAAGVIAVCLLRTYSYSSGWFAYAASDLGLAFCIGIVISRLFMTPRGGAPESGAIMRALVLLSVVALLGSAFPFYPDVIMSEPAVLQTNCALLTIQRVFPLLVMGAVIGALVPAPSACARWSLRARDAGVAALGMLLAGFAPASISPRWHYVAAALLCVLSLAPVCLRSKRGGLPLRVGAGVIGMAGLLWLACVPPWMHWSILRFTYATYSGPRSGRLNYSPPQDRNPSVRKEDVGVDGVTFDARCGVRAQVQGRGELGRMVRGNLMWSSRAQDDCAFRAAQALGYACSGAAAANGDDGGGAGGVVVLGPEYFAEMRCPLAGFDRERMAESLGRDCDVLVVWLPTRTISRAELRRLLATACAVFERTRLFACGDELILVAGGRERIDLPALESLFDDPTSGARLTKAGIWDARQLAVRLVADSENVKALAGDARPYSCDRPARPPALVRNLAEYSRGDVLAMATQYRLSVVKDLGRLIDFGSPAQRDRMLPALTALYRTVTRQTMLQVGEAGRIRSAELSAALRDGSLDLDLFAPREESPRMKLAVALHTFGLYADSLAALERVQWSAPAQFSAHYWRGRNLAQLARGKEALSAYRSALRERSGSVDTLMRIARLHSVSRRDTDAETALLRVLELAPQHLEAKVQLGYVYGRQRRYGEAAALARQVLSVDPGNEDALSQTLLYLQQGLQDREEEVERRERPAATDEEPGRGAE